MIVQSVGFSSWVGVTMTSLRHTVCVVGYVRRREILALNKKIPKKRRKRRKVFYLALVDLTYT